MTGSQTNLSITADMCLQPSKQSSVYREKLSKLPTPPQMPHKDNQRQEPGSNAACHSLQAPSLIPPGSASEALQHQTGPRLLLPHPALRPSRSAGRSLPLHQGYGERTMGCIRPSPPLPTVVISSRQIMFSPGRW